MAVLLQSRRRVATRPWQAVLNRDTALADGLQQLWPLAAGPRYQNIVTGQHLTVNATSAYQWGTHPVIGSCIYLPSGASSASMLISGLADISPPWSFGIWWHRIAGPTTVHVITSKVGSAIGVRGEQFPSTTNLGYSTAGSDFNSGIQASSVRAQRIVYVQPASGNMSLYVDGVSRATMVASAPVLTLSRIGNYADAVSLPIHGWFGHICAWNRALTAHDVFVDYQADTRWEIYWKPSHRRLFFTAEGGGGGGRYNYSTLLGIR